MQQLFVFFYFVLCLNIKLRDFELISILVQLYRTLVSSQHTVRCWDCIPLLDRFLFWEFVYMPINILIFVDWCINWLDNHSFHFLWREVAVIELFIFIEVVCWRVLLVWLLEWILRILVVHAVSVVFEALAVWCHLGFALTVWFPLLDLILLYLNILMVVVLLFQFLQKTLSIHFFFYHLTLLV